MLEYTTKQEWEMTRFKSYIVAQSQSTKKLKPKDIIEFSWDKNETTNQENKNTSITTEDVERLKRKAEKIIQEKKLSNNG